MIWVSSPRTVPLIFRLVSGAGRFITAPQSDEWWSWCRFSFFISHSHTTHAHVQSFRDLTPTPFFHVAEVYHLFRVDAECQCSACPAFSMTESGMSRAGRSCLE